MTDKHRQSLTIFNKLNTKIVIYFLSFAFLPLLIFSIFGYYLNKDLITRINNNNLRSLNTAASKELEIYLQSKQRIIIQTLEDFESSEKTGSLQTFINQQQGLKSDFLKVIVLKIPGDSAHESVVSTILDTASVPGFVFIEKDILVIGYIAPDEISNLLYGNVKEIHNSVYFLNSEKKLINGLFQSYSKDDINLLHKRAANSNISNEPVRFEKEGYVSSMTSLSDDDILIETRINAKIFYEELNSFRNKILFANFALAFILILLAIVFSRHITTPIHKLIEASQNIGRGKLEEKIDVKTNDEIKILANEFELMRNRLQESYQGMEEKIQRRTQELQEAQAQISHQEKMASLGMMAAGIAHEIGNPLTSISSMAQVIKRRNNNPQISEYVTNILKNIERISRIVRELVDFSRPSSYEEAPSDINEIIKSAVGIIKYDRRSKKLTYSLNLDPDIPKTVLVSDHLLQVFLNILINSVDASEGFGDKISVNSFTRNGNIHVEITDEGCGIPKDLQKKIFEPFYTTKEVGKGTGLGLTVSYGFIQKLKGEIKVISEEGKGSTFSVILPVRTHIEE